MHRAGNSSSFDICTDMLRYLKSEWAIDLRALGLMRIALGLMLLVDVYRRWLDSCMFYTDQGVLPRSFLTEPSTAFYHSWNPSFFMFTGGGLGMHLLFGLGILIALFVVLGYRTRLFSILAFLWLLSIQIRNPLILQGGDDYLRLMFLWGAFSPWGSRYSLDAWALRTKEHGHLDLSIFALLLQVTAVYLCTALMKSSAEWHTHANALYYALSLDQMIKAPGVWLLPQERILEQLTRATLVLEYLTPVLIFMPWQNRFFRSVAFVGLLVFHLGVELTMHVGLFSWVSISAALLLIPGNWMTQIERMSSRITQPIHWLYFQFKYLLPYRNPIGVCRICFGWQILLGSLIVLGLLKNADSLNAPLGKYERTVERVARGSGLFQHWGMFAPSVYKDDGWYILEARTENVKIDLVTGEEVSYEKPVEIFSRYGNARRRKLGENLRFEWNATLRAPYCAYLLEKWNREHPQKQVEELRVLYMLERTLPDYQTAPIEKEVITRCTCDE